ncbi:MAG TPA: putative quinol monooxygenase [Xanthobacteraceae bacterium]|nr:putative quinol monooxygenase [Xanthobacteraceae bacterium]
MVNLKPFLIGASLLAAIAGCAAAAAQDARSPYVQVAEIEIDPAQLDAYKAAVAEHAETAVRIEPGVEALYVVSDRDNPAHITVFEIYASAEAYKAHLEAPHFKKYKEVTEKMVRSLTLIKTVPIALAAKPN